jgi:type VI secretion system protein ImpK
MYSADDDKTQIFSLQKETSVKRVSALSQLDLTLLSYGEGQGINPLVNVAAPLLILLAELKQAHDCGDIKKLRERLTTEVRRFSEKARALQISPIQINLASYLLCASLDEFILRLLGKRANLWTPYALLSTFHKDGGAGEKFFAIIDQLLQDPLNNQMALEVAALCLYFGFEGKYQVMDNGAVQMQLFKDKVANQLIKLYGVQACALKTDVQSIKRRRPLLLRFNFVHLLSAFLGLSFVIYLIFVVFLNQEAKKPLSLLTNIAAIHTHTVQQ